MTTTEQWPAFPRLFAALQTFVAMSGGRVDRFGATLQEPFRTLLLSNSASATKNDAKGRSQPQIEDWLPGMDFEPRT